MSPEDGRDGDLNTGANELARVVPADHRKLFKASGRGWAEIDDLLRRRQRRALCLYLTDFFIVQNHEASSFSIGARGLWKNIGVEKYWKAWLYASDAVKLSIDMSE